MMLSQLLHVLPELDKKVTGLAIDSRLVKPGNIFFACKGRQSDGHLFIPDAIAKGACAIVVDAESEYLNQSIPVFPIPHLQQQIGFIAAKFFDHPARALKIVGITGTNGKTSCTHFVADALTQLSMPCGVIGTLGSGNYGHVQPGQLTTPDAITLQSIFADFVKQGVKIVAMEVSSHSIDQHRIEGIPFEVGIFTNLTRDHLDYHGDMASYGAVKKRLFENSLLKHAVINLDDSFGQTLVSLKRDTVSYSVNTESATVYVSDVKADKKGLQANVYTPWGEGMLHVPLVGQFNLSNVLAVLSTLCLLDIPFKDALRSLAALSSVPGRMQALGGHEKPLVVVDYAHTPDALEKVLVALKKHCQGRLYCLFGCGGDRDRGKRPLMAAIAEKYADQVIVTDDNPRHESPDTIMADILKGFRKKDAVIVQHDRSKAIQYIIQCAVVGDCILIAGKGAEMYQQVGDKKLPFSDVDKVNEFLGALP